MGLSDKFKAIADSIRNIKGTTDKIKPDNFSTEISKMAYIDNGNVTGKINAIEGQTITPSTSNKTITGNNYLKNDIVVQGDSNLTSENIVRGRATAKYLFGVHGEADKLVDINYDKPIWCGAYANEMVKVARSYWDARISGKVTFSYSGGSTIFEGKLTDANGNCYIDCSTYILLSLLGIDFNHSPYHKITGQVNKTIDANTILPRTDYSFEFPSLVSQLTSNFASGKIRYASDIAEYFYCQGKLIPIDEVMPGDLIFHASKYDDGSYHINNRFKNISHVSIVAEEKYIQRDSNNKVTYFEYYNVTSATNVIIRTKSTTRDDIVFCCRPDYRPRNTISEISNINLLSKSYHSGDVGITTLNGVQFDINEEGQISTTGQPSASTSFYLTSKSYPIYLKKGTYQLTGCPLREDTTSGRTWGIGIKNTDGTELAWDLGNGSTFTVTDDFVDVYVYVYISTSTKDSTGYVWNPNLIRIE